MSDTEAKEVPQLKNQDFQRFQPILRRAFGVGLESNVRKEVLAGRLLGPEFSVNFKPQNACVRHSGATNGVSLQPQLVLNPKLADHLHIDFNALPEEVPVLFQRLNLRQRVDDQVLGIAYGRFPVPGISEEKEAFYGKENPGTGERYFNPDCLSKSKVWNPLYVKYHLSVMPSLKENEFGYLRIDVFRDENRNIVVTVSRVLESEVPDILKTAKTLPR